jgi:hypothetical protein
MSRFKAFLNWLIPPEDEKPDARVDTGFLLEHADRYKFMSVVDESAPVGRCDLCGRLFELEQFPQLVDHVASHDGQGAAEINPFDEAEQRTMISEEMLEEVSDWREKNIQSQVKS